MAQSKTFVLLVIAGAIVYADIQFFVNQALSHPTTINSMLAFVSLFFGLLYLFIIIHIGPVYVYFPKLSVFEKIKLSLLMSIRYIFLSLTIVICLVLLIVFTYFFQFIGAILLSLSFALFVFLSLRSLRPKYEIFIQGSEPLFVSDYPKNL